MKNLESRRSSVDIIKDNSANQNCFEFAIEELNVDFLELLTKVHAYNVYDYYKNPDNNSNWTQGKKLTAFNIIECYLKQCNSKGECLPLPECCYGYLKEINIKDVKEYMAYFIWDRKGRSWNNSEELRKKDYFEACNQLMSFCGHLEQKGEGCIYHNGILCAIDRRRISERRVLPDRRIINMKISTDRRFEKERRKVERRANDHRGWSAKYFKMPSFVNLLSESPVVQNR